MRGEHEKKASDMLFVGMCRMFYFTLLMRICCSLSEGDRTDLLADRGFAVHHSGNWRTLGRTVLPLVCGPSQRIAGHIFRYG